MAKKNVRAEPINPQPTENGQLGGFAFLYDKEKFQLEAVSKDKKDGKYTTVPADKEYQNSFLKINRYENPIENFIKNFWSQYQNPTRFSLITIREDKLEDSIVRQALKDLSEGKRTKAVEQFLKQYAIVPKNQNTNNKNQTTMAKKNQQNEPQVATGGEQPNYRYNEAMINWDELKAFGISREFLQEKGLLDQMLKGYKTNQLVPLNINLDSISLQVDARLHFKQSTAGPIVLGVQGLKEKPALELPFLGHIFSDEDKKNLLETGNMGRVVELKSRDGKYVPSFVSIDKLTNVIVATAVDGVNIPNEIKGVTLTEQEKAALLEGKAVYVEGMISKSGNEFNSYIQFNADRRGLEFIFENKPFNGQMLGGVELTSKQLEDLQAGKAIFVEDMRRKDGEIFSSFVKLDEASGRLNYTRYNPDSPEDAREIYIPKEISGTKLTPQDRNDLRAGKAVFLEDMINRRGEQFSSFVKADLNTGQIRYSSTIDGFDQREQFKIPAEIWGVTLTATQRANLQDGKAVLVENMQGFKGPFSQYVKANFNQGRLDYYNVNPDLKKDAAQRNTVANAQNQEQGKGKGVSMG